MPKAIRADDEELRAALSTSRLPSDNLDNDLSQYFALIADDSAVAFGGISGSGPDRLLRSIVVPPSGRGLGYGVGIVSFLIGAAANQGVDRLWLLTTEASNFFARLGWRTVNRAAAPDIIRATNQFTSICPSSAALMVRDVRA